ncbi:MAG TPA: anti-sigma factor antagonist [Spirochaetia bacterium]|nr:anti-sigma factor antagonist [Spirochaetia bacterium]
MEEVMGLQTEKKGDIVIIYLQGRLDVHKSLEVEQDINEIIEKGEKNIIFNLKELSYLSSSGLRVFIATLRKLKEINGLLKIAEIQANVAKIFKIVEFDDIFEMYNTTEEALKSF